MMYGLKTCPATTFKHDFDVHMDLLVGDGSGGGSGGGGERGRGVVAFIRLNLSLCFQIK